MKIINVAGTAGAGKTTVAEIIKEALEAQGIKVSFEEREENQATLRETKALRRKSVTAKTEVKIVTVQTNRSALIR